MTKRLYVDIHILQTMPPSCVNRDDTGSPKTAIYGGVSRARISSQAWKKAVRDMFWGRYGEPLLDKSRLGQRTKDIIGLVCEKVHELIQKDNLGIDLEAGDLSDKVRETINLASEKPAKPIIPATTLSDIFESLTNASEDFQKEDDTESEQKFAHAIITIAEEVFPNGVGCNIEEINTINKAKKIIENRRKDLKGKENEKFIEGKLQEKLLKLINEDLAQTLGTTGDALFFMGLYEATRIAELVIDWIKTDKKPEKTKVFEALNRDKNNQNHAIDVALFGRMVAKAPVLNVDASCQVAHAISTHKVKNEFDFFTALDDRKKTQGAAMMGTSEYNSSTLYRYATIAVHDLYRQLTNKDVVLEAVRAFTDAFARSIPTGKINSSGNHMFPDAIYIAIRSDQPINLVGAYESPIPASDSGYVEESVARLAKKAKEIGKILSQPVISLTVNDLIKDIDGIVVMDSLSDLLSRLESEVGSIL